LRDPSAQEPTSHMPNLDLSEAEASALAAYLALLS
jgi:cytochrome c1